MDLDFQELNKTNFYGCSLTISSPLLLVYENDISLPSGSIDK